MEETQLTNEDKIMATNEKAYNYQKFLAREDAKDIFAKFQWNIEKLVDHMYLSSGEIKLADPLQVKRIVAQSIDSESCNGFRTTTQLRNSHDFGFSTKLTNQTF
jgi:hypothetical protein